jgi:hypothetical protein
VSRTRITNPSVSWAERLNEYHPEWLRSTPLRRAAGYAEISQTVRKRGFDVSPAISIGTGLLIARSEPGKQL